MTGQGGDSVLKLGTRDVDVDGLGAGLVQLGLRLGNIRSVARPPLKRSWSVADSAGIADGAVQELLLGVQPSELEVVHC